MGFTVFPFLHSYDAPPTTSALSLKPTLKASVSLEKSSPSFPQEHIHSSVEMELLLFVLSFLEESR